MCCSGGRWRRTTRAGFEEIEQRRCYSGGYEWLYIIKNVVFALPVQSSPDVMDDDNVDDSLTALNLSQLGSRNEFATPVLEENEKKSETLSFGPELLTAIQAMIKKEVINYLSER
ncbi:Transcription factor [Abeliophyllum distichum]|uniref:Transcription factor n=1 Tax=Abeliophyllum distichum TaxID=126358 RepID=A0ABD1VS94_9LAMI